MRILSRYLVREFLKFFLAAMAGFVVVYYILDVMDDFSNLVKYDAPIKAAFLVYLLELPQIVFYMMPLAVLVATLFVLSIMSKDNELIAVEASGVSARRFVAPLILLSILLSAFAFANGEFIAPTGNAKMDEIFNRDIKHESNGVFFRRDKFWFRSKNRIYDIQNFDGSRNTLGRVTLFRIGPGFRPVRRVDALKAKWIDGRWHFYGAIVRDFSPDGGMRVTTGHDMVIAIPETPKSFKVIEPDPDHFSYLKLRRYISKIRRDGYDTTRYLVDLDAKLATPLVSFVSCLIAIPFALRRAGSRGQPLGTLIVLVLAATYWFVLAYCLAFGHKGVLQPVLAAWIPNVLFGTLGALSLVNMKL